MSDETRIQWHEAFCAAMETTFYKEKEFLTFEDEHPLSRKSLKIDLVISKRKDGPLSEEIGRIFRKYNLLEYKSPGDELNIDTFYKGIAYACLYKALTGKVNEIRAEEISISFAREEKPKRLFAELTREGKWITLYDHGIYIISGYEPFAVQILVIEELNDRYFWLKSLTRHISREEAENIVNDVSRMPPGTEQRSNGETVLQVVMHANKDVFRKMKEDYAMIPALRELFKPEIEAAEQAAKEAAKEAAEQAAKEAAEQAAREATLDAGRNSAMRMLADGKLSVEDIARYSALSTDEVKRLQTRLQS